MSGDSARTMKFLGLISSKENLYFRSNYNSISAPLPEIATDCFKIINLARGRECRWKMCVLMINLQLTLILIILEKKR